MRQKLKVKAYSFCEVVEFHQTFECGGDDGATASQSLHRRTNETIFGWSQTYHLSWDVSIVFGTCCHGNMTLTRKGLTLKQVWS